MKYDIDLDPAEANTSHGLVADLVGSGRRVLDVGCSTGYLGRLLSDRGNTVVGLEVDPQAAEAARRWLETVLVADVEAVDLVAEVGAGSFDVVVFADVLEHLRDPVAVLRGSLPLLRPGGFVVASIPNVAHGAVRLSLLEGRFDYGPLGLLDETHLRFFTRSSVEDLLRSAGLVATEMRRTTAGVFGTEIPLDAQRYPEQLISSLDRDPDATTYQFVVKSVPSDDSPAVVGLAAELVAKDRQLQELRAQLGEVVAAVPDPLSGPTVALVSPVASPSAAEAALRASVVEGELRRRLLGFAIRRYGADASEPSATWTGEPVHPVQPWTSRRGSELASAVDALVAIGGAPAGPLASELCSRGCPVFRVGPPPPTGADGPGEEGWSSPRLELGPPPKDGDVRGVRRVPDPLLLAARIHPVPMLQRRVDYLRMLGQLPETGDYLLVALEQPTKGSAGAVARALEEIAERLGSSLVFAESPPGSGSHPVGERREAPGPVLGTRDPMDLLSAAVGCRLLVTDSAGMVALAIGAGRPCQAYSDEPTAELADLASWTGDPDLVAKGPAMLLAGVQLADARARDARLKEQLVDTVDLALDELANELLGAPGRRAASSVSSRLAEINDRLGVLQAANLGLQQRMAAERAAFGERAAQLLAGSSMRPVKTDRLIALEAEFRLVQAQHDAARKELEAVYATKTMRILKPARERYYRLRNPGR